MQQTSEPPNPPPSSTQPTSSRPPTQPRTSYGFVGRIGAVFLAPESAFIDVILHRVSFIEPLLLVLSLIIVHAIVVTSFIYRITTGISSLIGATATSVFFGFFFIVPVAMIIGMLIGVLITWVILAGIAHLVAVYIFRGSGSFINLMKLYGYTFAPYSLVILSMVLLSLSIATLPLAMFFWVISFFWIILLMSIAVRQNYNIDAGKGFISSFIGPMTLGLIITGVFWTWLWMATGGSA